MVAERLTGEPAETFSSAAMQWGVDQEPRARAAYEFFADQSVHYAGFVAHPRIAMSGASPDGFVGDDGLIGSAGLFRDVVNVAAMRKGTMEVNASTERRILRPFGYSRSIGERTTATCGASRFALRPLDTSHPVGTIKRTDYISPGS